MPLLVPEHDVIPPSIAPLNCCVRLHDTCNCGEIGKEQGPPAKAYEGAGEGIALVNLQKKIRCIFETMVVYWVLFYLGFSLHPHNKCIIN